MHRVQLRGLVRDGRCRGPPLTHRCGKSFFTMVPNHSERSPWEREGHGKWEECLLCCLWSRHQPLFAHLSDMCTVFSRWFQSDMRLVDTQLVHGFGSIVLRSTSANGPGTRHDNEMTTLGHDTATGNLLAEVGPTRARGCNSLIISYDQTISDILPFRDQRILLLLRIPPPHGSTVQARPKCLVGNRRWAPGRRPKVMSSQEERNGSLIHMTSNHDAQPDTWSRFQRPVPKSSGSCMCFLLYVPGDI